MSAFEKAQAEIAATVRAIVEARLGFVLATPPVAKGWHRHVAMQTTAGCPCGGSGVRTEALLAAGVFKLEECRCAVYVARDYPDESCPDHPKHFNCPCALE